MSRSHSAFVALLHVYLCVYTVPLLLHFVSWILTARFPIIIIIFLFIRTPHFDFGFFVLPVSVRSQGKVPYLCE